MLAEFKSLKQVLSEFRSEAIIGRYARALEKYCKLEKMVESLKTRATPDIVARLGEVEKSLVEEKRMVQELHESYPPLLMEEPPSLQMGPKQSNSSGKWSKKWSKSDNQSKTEKQELQPQLNEQEQLYYQHLLQETADSSPPTIDLSRYIGQDQPREAFEGDILLSFKMPMFFRKATKSPILLYGHPHNGKSTLIKCLASLSNLTFIRIDLLSVSSSILEDIEQLLKQLILKKRNHVFYFADIHQYSQDLKKSFEAICQFQLRHPSRSLVVASTSEPESLPKELVKVFRELLHMRLPSEKEREQLIEQSLATSFSSELVQQLLPKTAKASSGMVVTFVRQFLKTAATSNLPSLDEIPSFPLT